MKILNSINGKFKSEEHRKRFEKLNDKALEKIDKDIRKEEDKIHGQYHGRPKYGGMVTGQYGSQNWIQWDRPYDLDEPRPPSGSFHLGGKPHSELVGKNQEEEETIEINQRDFPLDNKEPEFKNKVEEDIWRLKNKK